MAPKPAPRLVLDLDEELARSEPTTEKTWAWAWAMDWDGHTQPAHHLFPEPLKLGLQNAAWRTALCGARFSYVEQPGPGGSCPECERREALGFREPPTAWTRVLDEPVL